MTWRIVFALTSVALLLFGLVMVFSASSIEAINEGESSWAYLFRQVMFAAVGVAAAIGIAVVLPMNWLRNSYIPHIFWLICTVLLILVAAIGTFGLGAKRWLTLGPVNLQPSELAKIAVVIMAARIFVDWREGRSGGRELVRDAVVFLLLPMGMVFVLQSDMGTAAIMAFGILAVMWLSEVRAAFVIGIIVLGVAVVLSTLIGSDYRSDRWVFLDPYNDGEGGYGAGYQLIHSYYAFGQGGLFGVGLGASREKYLYLSEAETDFIFAVVGEELGLVGALAVIALFALFCVSGLMIARYSADAFAGVLAGGITLLIVSQALVNIGCVIGVLPTTGKPLPFFSYGGSSLISTLACVGLVLLVSKDAMRSDVYEARRDNLRVVRSSTGATSR